MAVAIIEAIAGAAGWEELFFFAAGNAGIINATAFVVASYAYGQHEQQKLREQAKQAANDAARDRQVMIRSAIAPRPVVYGKKKLSGLVAYAQSTGSLGQYLHIVVALTGHECDAIETIYFNDTVLPAPDGNGFIQSGVFCKHNIRSAAESSGPAATMTLSQTPTGTMIVTESDEAATFILGVAAATEITSPSGYTLAGNVLTFTNPARYHTVNYQYDTPEPKVRIKTHLGAPGQAADATLISESGGKWTSAHRGEGICYIYARLEYDQDVFGQIGIPNISAFVRGKKIYDPRNGGTAWSNNAALCVRDWLRDPVLGLGCTAAEVPDTEIIIAANICDEDMAGGDYFVLADQGNAIGDNQGNVIGV